MPSRKVFTALGGLIWLAMGFGAGTGAAALRERGLRADPWRKVQVDHRGLKRNTTTTRVAFQNAKLPLRSVEVVRKPGGKPVRASVEPRKGTPFTVRFGSDGRPQELIDDAGHHAVLTYKGSSVRVSFLGKNGKTLGDKVLKVPLSVRPALKKRAALAPSLRWFEGDLIPSAHAQGKPAPKPEDPPVTVEREVKLDLGIRLPNLKGPHPPTAQIEASCAPYVCLPVTPTAKMGGTSEVVISVAATTQKSALGANPEASELSPFTKVAQAERKLARKVMPNVAAVIGAVGVTASACRSLRLAWPICVTKLSSAKTGAAILAVRDLTPKTTGALVSQRAENLYFEEHARARLDRSLTIEVCASADRFNRSCVKLKGRPLGVEPMPKASKSVELRKGIGGTLKGDHEMRQRDGSDCKFSPSPLTRGPLSMTFDNEKGIVTAKISADARGTRPSLGCSLGTGDLRWSQKYSATLTQTFSVAQLTGGGKLQLQLRGNMTGRGSGHMSNCRTRSGGSVSCPAGKNETYSYPTTLYGTLDLDTRKGSGTLRVTRAKLSTSGTWSIPGKNK